MTELLERLGDQLRRAEQDYARSVQGGGRAVAAPETERRGRRRRVLAAAALSGMAAGAIALLVASSGAASKPPAAQLAILRVLRRPPSAQDRRALGEAGLSRAALAALAPRPGYVRLLAKTTDRWVALVSEGGPGLSGARGTYGHHNDLCLLFSTPSVAREGRPSAHSGVGTLCGDTAMLRAGEMVTPTGTALIGVAPDGVARVAFTYGRDRILTAPVHENFFWLEGAAGKLGGRRGSSESSIPSRSLGAKPAERAAPERVQVDARPLRVEWLGPTSRRLAPTSGALAPTSRGLAPPLRSTR
jgi:hypothetical protein